MATRREDLIPGEYFLNGSGDLAFEFDIRPYINTYVQVLKKCRSGLYYVHTPDGKFFSVAKHNLDTREEREAYLTAPRVPFDPSLWTVEPTVHLQAQHGLDLESEIVAQLIKEFS